MHLHARDRRYQAFGWDLRLHPWWDKPEDNKGQSRPCRSAPPFNDCVLTSLATMVRKAVPQAACKDWVYPHCSQLRSTRNRPRRLRQPQPLLPNWRPLQQRTRPLRPLTRWKPPWTRCSLQCRRGTLPPPQRSERRQPRLWPLWPRHSTHHSSARLRRELFRHPKERSPLAPL